MLAHRHPDADPVGLYRYLGWWALRVKVGAEMGRVARIGGDLGRNSIVAPVEHQDQNN
jgi:hypothetical protein